MNRRAFIKIAGGSSLSLMAHPALAGADSDASGQILVPADKGLSDEWLKSLTARGDPEIYRGDDLKYIGMPVGGLCAGLVYLGGDGKPWLWDIFNRNTMDKKITYGGKTFNNREGSLYVEPMVPESPFAHGFALKYQAGAVSGQRTLDKEGGWPEITFQGSYPQATVNYGDPAVPLTVELKAFSPFIPLNIGDSSLPATILCYTVTNTGSSPATVELAGWMENVVLSKSTSADDATRQNQLIGDATYKGVLLTSQVHESTGRLAANLPPIAKRNDYGTMALVLLQPGDGVSTVASLPAGKPEENAFGSHEAAGVVDQPVGAVKRSFTLGPGENTTLNFVLSWNFPNVDPKIQKDVTHHYATRFPDAAVVAQYVAANFACLFTDTLTWVETWNDSTLPHWFLQRTFSNTCNLATTTSYRFADGQFWA